MVGRALLTALLIGSASLAVANDDIFKETTEFGVTVTTTDLIDAIQETQDFWYPVRMYVGSDKFAEADAATRQQAAELIRQVNNRLADQLFSQDDAASLDLIDYLGTRLRLFTTYRELRTTVADDHATISIKDHWERELRAAHALGRDRRTTALQAARVRVTAHVKTVGVAEDRHPVCLNLWDRAGQLWSRLNDSQAGKIMLEYERQVEQCEPPLAQLVRDVVCAADWAQITKQDRLVKRADFERAWCELAPYRGARVATLPAAVAR